MVFDFLQFLILLAVVLALTAGEVVAVGAYDLIVFLRQNVGGLSFETCIELPEMVRVRK